MPSLEEEEIERLISKQLDNPEGRLRLAMSLLNPLQRAIDRGVVFREKGSYDWSSSPVEGSLLTTTWTRLLAKASDAEKATPIFLQVEGLFSELWRPYREGEAKLADIFKAMSPEALQHIRPAVLVRFRDGIDKVLNAADTYDDNPSLWDRLEDM